MTKKYSLMQDEFTEKMHLEFTVNDETDLKHRVWAAARTVEDGYYSQEEALTVFGIDAADYYRILESEKG